MRAALWLPVLISCCRAYTTPMLSRSLVTQMGAVNFLSPRHERKHALVVSCGDAGRAIAQRLRQDGYHITVATTKPKREEELRSLADRVVVVPQIETQNDEALAGCVLRSDLVVLADTIRIFSPHTFVRTAHRVAKVVSDARWPGTLALVSSENAYGCPRRGEVLKEDRDVVHASMQNRTQWRLNTNVMALQIRHAEAMLRQAGAGRCLVLRAAGLWDERKFFDTAKHNAMRELPFAVGESLMSFATTNLVAEVVVRAAREGVAGTYNVANLPPVKRKDFLRSLHCMYGMQGPVWRDELELDQDAVFSIDSDPMLPSSQRGHSRMDCGKLHGVLGLGKV
jgi:nucleoside-diphosphate-sugar epimerase